MEKDVEIITARFEEFNVFLVSFTLRVLWALLFPGEFVSLSKSIFLLGSLGKVGIPKKGNVTIVDLP